MQIYANNELQQGQLIFLFDNLANIFPFDDYNIFLCFALQVIPEGGIMYMQYSNTLYDKSKTILNGTTGEYSCHSYNLNASIKVCKLEYCCCTCL